MRFLVDLSNSILDLHSKFRLCKKNNHNDGRCYDSLARSQGLKDDLAKYIDAEVLRCGWPGDYEISSQAHAGLLSIALNASDSSFPLIREAAVRLHRNRILKDRHFAAVLDESLVKLGLPQIYGSRLKENNGEYIPGDVFDDGNLDKRRLAVGLDPFCIFLATEAVDEEKLNNKCTNIRKHDDNINK